MGLMIFIGSIGIRDYRISSIYLRKTAEKKPGQSHGFRRLGRTYN